MAFVRFDDYSAKALEKGLYLCIRAGDWRWSNSGADEKKSTPDDEKLGPVAYVKLNDPSDDDPVLSKIGTITKMFFRCEGSDPSERYAAVETTHDVQDAVLVAKNWVSGMYTSAGKPYFGTLRLRTPSVT